MTLNCYKFEFSENFEDFADLGGNTSKGMKIDPYCQRERVTHVLLTRPVSREL